MLLLMLVPLAIVLLPLLWRTLGASNAAHAPDMVHQALTPERIYILGCSLFALATLMSTFVAFDPTVWGLLLSVAIIGPLVSYAQHVGELRRILKPREPHTNAPEEEPSRERELLADTYAWRAHLQENPRHEPLAVPQRTVSCSAARALALSGNNATTFRTNVESAENHSTSVETSVNT